MYIHILVRAGNRDTERINGTRLRRSMSVPNAHVSVMSNAGLETPGGYSFSQNDASNNPVVCIHT
jgi:hypothetical protein